MFMIAVTSCRLLVPEGWPKEEHHKKLLSYKMISNGGFTVFFGVSPAYLTKKGLATIPLTYLFYLIFLES